MQSQALINTNPKEVFSGILGKNSDQIEKLVKEFLVSKYSTDLYGKSLATFPTIVDESKNRRP